MFLIDLQSELKIQLKLYRNYLPICPIENLKKLTEEIVRISEVIDEINETDINILRKPVDSEIFEIESNLNYYEE